MVFELFSTALLVFLLEPHVVENLVYLVHIDLSQLLLFQLFWVLVAFSIYDIYSTIITMSILLLGYKMDTLFTFA